MKTVEEALEAIPGRARTLSEIDRRLSYVIRYCERVLGRLGLGVSVDHRYKTDEGNFVLTYKKWAGVWHIMWGNADVDDETKDVDLVSAPRHVRAEVFIPMLDPSDNTTLAPIERLFIAAAHTLVEYTHERSVPLETARRLVEVLEKAGFRNEDDRDLK